MSSVTTQPTATNGKAVGLHQVMKKYFKRFRDNTYHGIVDKPRCRSRWSLAYGMADMGLRTGVEIGVMRGESAEIWCTPNPELRLTGIDPYGPYRHRGDTFGQDKAYEDACEFVSQFNMKIIRDYSWNIVGQYRDQSLDFLHIDGDHSFDSCMLDLIQWVPKVRRGGVVCIHDCFAANWPGVTYAVNSYLFAHRIATWYIAYDTTPSIFWQA